MMAYFFFLLNFRFIYLRVIDSGRNDLVSLLMINILAQMGVELFSKVYLIYGDKSCTIFYNKMNLVFGWKTIYLFIVLTHCSLSSASIDSAQLCIDDFGHRFRLSFEV
jgi:hypothetical protein